MSRLIELVIPEKYIEPIKERVINQIVRLRLPHPLEEGDKILLNDVITVDVREIKRKRLDEITGKDVLGSGYIHKDIFIDNIKADNKGRNSDGYIYYFIRFGNVKPKSLKDRWYLNIHGDKNPWLKYY